MGPKRRARRIARNAKYTVPVGEHSPGGQDRLDRKGRIKKGYKVVGGDNTSGRIPYSTVAVPKRMKSRRRVAGAITPQGKGITKKYG